MPAFIETQFPIARLSAESYKERKAVSDQTLTGLGKWWGRKPLILVRAANLGNLGTLMPASADAKKDREVFLRVLTMDDDSAWQRCKPDEARKLGRAQLQASPMADLAERVRAAERARQDAGPLLARINAHFGTSAASLPGLRLALGEQVFRAMPYAHRIALCERPENSRLSYWLQRHRCSSDPRHPLRPLFLVLPLPSLALQAPGAHLARANDGSGFGERKRVRFDERRGAGPQLPTSARAVFIGRNRLCGRLTSG